MVKPQLFLLTPGYGAQGHQFCPDCALVEGYFQYQPALRDKVQRVYTDFERPRSALVQLLGEQLQNCPALVFAEGEQPAGAARSPVTGRAYLNDGRAICRWLGENYGGLVPS